MSYLDLLNNAKSQLLDQADELNKQANAYIQNTQNIFQAKLTDYADKVEQAGEFLVGAVEIGRKAKSIYDSIQSKVSPQETAAETPSAQINEEAQPPTGDREMSNIEEPQQLQSDAPQLQETNIDQVISEQSTPPDANPSLNADPVDEATAQTAPDSAAEAADLGAQESSAISGETLSSTVESGLSTLQGVSETVGAAGEALEAVPVVGEVLGGLLFIGGLIGSIFENKKNEEEEQQAAQQPIPVTIGQQIVSTVGQSTTQLQNTASGVLNYII